MATMFEPNYAVNARVFDIAAEGELANILSHYNSEFIYNTVTMNIAQKNQQYANILQMPNIVSAIEQEFQYLRTEYKSEDSDILQTRAEVYKNIIDILCKQHNLVFKDNGDIDYYSAAFCLYDFLVSNFGVYVVNFFTTFIVSEAQSIYDLMNLGALKKNKDTSSIYAKKMYDDSKLAAIASNLASVLYNISAYDIPFYTILSNTVMAQTRDFLYMIVQPQDNFFKDVYCKFILDDNNLPLIVTNIRLELQRRYGNPVPQFVPPTTQPGQETNDQLTSDIEAENSEG